jgi:hypothetical protein
MSSLCHEVKSDCRVDLPRISTMSTPGGECVIERGKIGDLGSKVYVTPDDVTYYRPGVTIREFNHAGLRLPQKRTFLGPEFFDSGCATLYGSNRFNNGPSSTNESLATESMFNYSFAPRPYYEGNDFSCVSAGSKCASVNSALGWMLNSDGQVLWKVNVQNDLNGAKTAQCGQ